MTRLRAVFVAGLVALALTLVLGACSTSEAERDTRRTTTTRFTTTTTTTTTTTVPATTTTAPAPRQLPPGGALGFGDSVMVDAAPALNALGIAVDAGVNRQFFNAARDLLYLAIANKLPPTVVVGLGTNGPFSPQQFDEVMRVLTNAKVQRVAFVNTCDPVYWQDQVNADLAAGVERWKQQAVLVDWHAAACGRWELFAADRTHVNAVGAFVYADAVIRAIGVR